jgi:hypothetical protein
MMAFFGAFLLMLSVWLVMQFSVPFLEAFKWVFIFLGATLILSMMVLVAFGAAGDSSLSSIVIRLVIALAVGAAIYGTQMRYPRSSEPIGIVNGAVVQLVFTAMYMGVLFVVAAAIMRNQ